MESEPKKYDYTFSLWPDTQRGFSQELFEMFTLLGRRIQLTYSPVEFEVLRSRLSHDGITIREVERIPHHDPEVVL